MCDNTLKPSTRTHSSQLLLLFTLNDLEFQQGEIENTLLRYIFIYFCLRHQQLNFDRCHGKWTKLIFVIIESDFSNKINMRKYNWIWKNNYLTILKMVRYKYLGKLLVNFLNLKKISSFLLFWKQRVLKEVIK